MTRTLAAAALVALAACSPDHWTPPEAPVTPPPPRTPPLGYHTSMALAVVGGTPKLYVPTALAGTSGDLLVVDPTVPGRGTRGAGAQLGKITLGAGESATAIAGDDRVLVAVSANTPKAWIIDPATDTVTKAIPLDGLGRTNFGGREAYVTAVIVDPDRNRAWLAVWNGILAIDLTLGARVPAEDVLAAPSEAPGYDPVRGLIYSVFEDCLTAFDGPVGSTPPPCDSYTAPGPVPMPAGLDIIRVSDGARFTLQRPGALAATPLGLGPDSVAVDATANLAVVADEGTPTQLVVDLSALTLDPATHTASLPEAAYSGYPDFAHSATAIEEGSGLVVMAGEFSPSLAFGTVAEMRAGTPLIHAEMPLLPVFPNGEIWVTGGEPHASFVARIGGKRYGFLVEDSRRWLARLDLDQVDATSPVTPFLLTPAELAPAVTYLDLTRAP